MWFESCWLQGWLVSQCVFCTLLHLRCNAACKGWRVEVNEIELAACKTLARGYGEPCDVTSLSLSGFLNVEQHAIAATVSQKDRSTLSFINYYFSYEGRPSVPHLHLLVVLVVEIRPGLERVDTI